MGFRLSAGVLKPAVAFGAGVAVEPVAFGLEKKEVRLFCFRDSVEGFVLGAMVKVATLAGEALLGQTRWYLFGPTFPHCQMLVFGQVFFSSVFPVRNEMKEGKVVINIFIRHDPPCFVCW